MNRSKAASFNALSAAISVLVTLITGLVVQKVLVSTLGIEYTGLNSLFMNVISMMSIAELGVGTAIVYNLYRPIHEGDNRKIAGLLNFYKSAYKIISVVIVAIGVVIAPFLPLMVGNHGINESLYLIFALFIADVVFSYVLAYKRSLLLAYRRNFVINIIHTIIIASVTILQTVILLVAKNYILFLIVKIVSKIVENLIIGSIVDRDYKQVIIPNEKIDSKTKAGIFKNVKGLLFHRVGLITVFGTDNIIISVMLGLKVLGLNSNYMVVVSALNVLVGQIFANLVSTVGNILVDTKSKTFVAFKKLRFINYLLAIVFSTGFCLCVQDFIVVWLGDTKFLLSLPLVMVLTINMFFTQFRAHISTFKEAAGIFYEDRFIPILESIINLVTSIVLAYRFGLTGVFIGTVLSGFILHLYSYPKYVYTKLFKRSYAQYYCEFFKYVTLAITSVAIAYLITGVVELDNIWLSLVKNGIIAVAVPLLVTWAALGKTEEFKYAISIIKKMLSKIRSLVRK